MNNASAPTATGAPKVVSNGPTPVIAAPNMSSVNKLSDSKLTSINALCTTVAIFFGLASLLSAISGFTKGEWRFAMPFSGFLNFVLNGFGLMLVEEHFVALIAAACGGIAIFTLFRITDVENIKKAWSHVSAVMGVVGVVYLIATVCAALTGLLNLSSKNLDQSSIWLNQFLPYLLIGGCSLGLAFVASKIAKGDINFLRALAYLAVGLASLAAILVIIATIVSMSTGGSYGMIPGGLGAALEGLKDIFDIF